MTIKELNLQQKSFERELKRVRKLKSYYVRCKKLAEKRHDSEELTIRQQCLDDFEVLEKQLENIIEGIEMQKSGKVYFTKDAECRYKERRPGM